MKRAKFILGAIGVLVLLCPVLSLSRVTYDWNPAPYSYVTGTNVITSWVSDCPPAAGEACSPAADDGYFDLSLGDFSFQFYGVSVSTLRISTNGYMTFGTGGQEWESYWNYPIPYFESPNALIAPFWTDLILSGSGQVRSRIIGNSPFRELVVEWFQVPYLPPNNTTPTGAYSFEAILYESTNKIKFQYLNVLGTDCDLGSCATVGVENFCGTLGLQFSFNTPLLSNSMAIEFIPTDRTDITKQKIMELVTEYYNNILDRPPDSGGAEYWTAEIERMMSLCIDINEGFIAVGKWFFNSDEYLTMDKTDTAYVIDLYETFLDRTPDPVEVDGWVGYITGGATRNIVLNFFVFSPEFNAYMDGIFGVSTVRPENNLVNDFYRGILSRLPDSAGFNYWLGLMRAAQCAGSDQQIKDLSYQIAALFLASPEYVAKGRTNLGYVENLYDAIMRRSPDLGGVNFWVGVLDGATWTRDQVLQYFTSCPEFQDRVTEVINAGCL